MPDKQQQKKTTVNYMEVGRGSQLISCGREAEDHMKSELKLNSINIPKHEALNPG